MKSEFSEFSYGYAVTEEIVRMANVKMAAPQFPSLYEEGKKGGYDVYIKSATPVFLQFKLSEYMKDSRAAQFSTFKEPYYRFEIRPAKISKQHHLLLNLEDSGENVFYIAPEFHEINELDTFYKDNKILFYSAAFSPKDIGSICDDDYHSVCFTRLSIHGYRFSEPRFVRKTMLTQGIRSITKKKSIRPRIIDKERIEQMTINMIDTIKRTDYEWQDYMDSRREKDIKDDFYFEALAPPEILSVAKKNQDYLISHRTEILERLRSSPSLKTLDYIARTFFDSHLFFVPEE